LKQGSSVIFWVMNSDLSISPSSRGLSPGVEPLGRARLRRGAHDGAMADGVPPQILRDLVASSWQRRASAGVDPDRPAPKILASSETARGSSR
jgi:hypothetical protein